MADQPNSFAHTVVRITAILTAAMALVALGGQNWVMAIWGGLLSGGLFLGSRALKPKTEDRTQHTPPASSAYREPVQAQSQDDDGVTHVRFTSDSQADSSLFSGLYDETPDEPDVVEPIEALFEWIEESTGQWPEDALVQVTALAAAVTDFSETNSDGEVVFDAAALVDAPSDVLAFLLSTRAKPEEDDDLLGRVLDNDPKLATVQFLLDNGFSAKGPSESYESLLEQVIAEEMEDSFALALLQAGAKPTDTTVDDQDILAYVVESNASHAVLELMLAQGYSPNPEDDHPLMIAVANEDDLSQALLLHHGANPLARDDNEQTPLQMILEDDSDPAALARLIGALDDKRQQRALGWIEASGAEDDVVAAVEEHLAAQTNLQQAWMQGYGDPILPQTRNPNPAQATLDSALLQHADDILKVQNLLLLGADPLAMPRGQASALDTALANQDPLLVGAMLESLSDTHAQAWLDNVKDHDSYAVALRLRRAQRARFIEQARVQTPAIDVAATDQEDTTHE